MKLNRKLRLIVAVLLFTRLACAHEGKTHIAPDSLWSAWSFEPWIIAGLLVTGGFYLLGLLRMSTKPPKGQIASFAVGMAALAVTLLSPIHRLGSELFSAHMTQHELLMLIAAPLLVIGQAGIPLLWALPHASRTSIGRIVGGPAFRIAWEIMSAPFAAWLIHGSALWLWHLPLLYQATLDSELVHAIQHVTFLGTALLFWWTLLHGRGGRMRYGAAVAYLFTTAVHTSVLGALLTCSSKLWYPAYTGRTGVWGLSALEDQQLGGLIMWVPAGVVYIGIGLWLFAAWLRESDLRLGHAQSSDLLRASPPKGVQDA
jgi:putative membrane protein